MHGEAPKYICDMVTYLDLDYTRVRRSPGQFMLKRNLVKTKYSLRAFKNNSAFYGTVYH